MKVFLCRGVNGQDHGLSATSIWRAHFHKFSIVFKPCFANAVFSVRCTRVNKLKKKRKWALHMSNSHLYKEDLPVYIYIHSSLIEPVEITALQIIVIIDHCVIHSPRLNMVIYLFKKNQRMDTSIQGTQALV